MPRALAVGARPTATSGGRPRREGDHADPAAARGRHHRAGAGHRGGRLPARPVVGPLPARGRRRALPRRGRSTTARCRGPGRLALADPRRRRRAEDGRSTPTARDAVRLGLLLAPTADPLAGRARRDCERTSTTRSSGPWCGCSPAWRWPASRVDPTELRSIADELAARVQLPRGNHPRAGRRDVQRELGAAAADGALRAARAHPGRKTKTGFSTDARTLEKLRGQHPIIDTLLRYREVEKLRSTYGESLAAEVADDGRIHATFRQTVARTGRLSSDRPNLHNIPVRTEEGRRFREAFVPADGRRLLGGRLRPDRAAGHRPSVRRPRADRGLRRRRGHPPHDGRPGVRRRPRGGDRRPAVDRPRWSPTDWPTGWRPTASPSGSRSPVERPRRSSRVLRRLPGGARVHGPDGGRGPVRGYTETALRPAPSAARSRLAQLPAAQGGRAPGHERRHPGPRRRPVQGGPGPPRRRARGAAGSPRELVLQVHDEVLVEWCPRRRTRSPRSPRRRWPAPRAGRAPRGVDGLGRLLGRRQGDA